MLGRMMLGFLVSAGLMTGCGGSDGLSPSAACHELSEALCGQFYSCLTPDERADAELPATESGCVTQLDAELGCPNATAENFCDPNQRYQANEANTCIDQVDNLSCSQLKSSANPLAGAPACGRVCVEG